jgi:hypothetical protein
MGKLSVEWWNATYSTRFLCDCYLWPSLPLDQLGTVGRRRLPGKLRGDAMNDTEHEFDRTEDILTEEITDEALEIAAGDERAGGYTLYFCTALDLCPGP